MLAPGRGSAYVIRPIAVAPVVVLGILALALAGCGRKGPLDAPPSAAITQPAGAAASETAAVDADGRPMAPPGKKDKLPIDWILD